MKSYNNIKKYKDIINEIKRMRVRFKKISNRIFNTIERTNLILQNIKQV